MFKLLYGSTLIDMKATNIQLDTFLNEYSGDNLRFLPKNPISENCKDFLRKLLQKDPENRMTKEELVEHPLIKDKLNKIPNETSIIDLLNESQQIYQNSTDYSQNPFINPFFSENQFLITRSDE